MTLRVGIWQCRSAPLDVAGNLARLSDACERAARERADVLVTPELFVTGYDIPAADTRRLAEPADGAIAAAVAGISRATGVAVVYGFPELADGAVHNSAQLVDGDARLGLHRKLHLYEGLDDGRFVPGAGPSPLLDLRGHPVALLICYDVEFPEPVRAAALRGARAVLVPTANPTGFEIVSRTLVPARAYENGVHVAYANYCGDEGGTRYAGLSTVCHPDGEQVLLGAGEEALVVVELAPRAGAPQYLRDRRDDLLPESPTSG